MQRKFIHASRAFAIVVLACGAANAQSQSQTGGASSDLKIAVTEPKEAMRELRAAVRELREASVLLLNQKEQSPARDKAVDSAQRAIGLAQQAMVRLPAQFRTTETREAKDWPLAASRLDKASLALERAVETLEKQGGESAGKDRQQTIETLHKAMNEVQSALLSMPDWKPGSK